jgi:AcrR family transcriptional regulator
VARDSRNRMLDSAIELFREHGYNGTGFRQVVAHSGAPRGSIYHHFPQGKVQLGVEALELAGDRIEAVFRQGAVEGDDFVSAFEWVWSWWTGYVVGTDFEAGCPVAAVAAESHPEAPQLRDATNAVFERWQVSIAAGLQASGVSEADARGLAALIIAAQEGATLLARARRSPEPLERVGRSLAALLGDRLAKAASSPTPT